MKQIILATMVVMTIASSAQAETSDWDYFWGTTVSEALDPKLNGWDEFWYQCQDPDKTIGDCVGTVAAGIGFAIAAPLAAAGVIAGGAGIVAGGVSTGVVTAVPTAVYITTGPLIYTTGPAAATGMNVVAMTTGGAVVFAPVGF